MTDVLGRLPVALRYVCCMILDHAPLDEGEKFLSDLADITKGHLMLRDTPIFKAMEMAGWRCILMMLLERVDTPAPETPLVIDGVRQMSESLFWDPNAAQKVSATPDNKAEYKLARAALAYVSSQWVGRQYHRVESELDNVKWWGCTPDDEVEKYFEMQEERGVAAKIWAEGIYERELNDALFELSDAVPHENWLKPSDVMDILKGLRDG